MKQDLAAQDDQTGNLPQFDYSAFNAGGMLNDFSTPGRDTQDPNYLGTGSGLPGSAMQTWDASTSPEDFMAEAAPGDWSLGGFNYNFDNPDAGAEDTLSQSKAMGEYDYENNFAEF